MIKFLLRKFRKRIVPLVLLIAADAGKSVFSVLFALGSRGVVNSAVGGSREELLQAAMVQAAIIVGILLCTTLSRFLHTELTSVLDRDMKQSLFHKLLKGEYEKVSAFHSGELINRLNNDVRIIIDGVLSTLPGFAAMITQLVAVIVVMAAMEPWFVLIMAGVGVVLILATAIAREKLQTLNKRVSEADGKLSGFLQEALEKLLLVQATDVSEEIERRADVHMENRYRLQKKRRRISVASNACVSVVTHAASFAALLWGGFGIFYKTMTYGDLTALLQLVNQLKAPFVNLSGAFPKFFAMMASCERLMELEATCENDDSVAAKVDARQLYQTMEAIEADGLTFSYGRDSVLQKGTFLLPKGAFAAIVGPSGVGKSTLLRLLLGIYRPQDGRLCIRTREGTVEIGTATRSLFAYVPQGNLLFSGTLRENLLLTKPDATEDEIQQAVRLSCMDAYIPQLPDGLETVLGENAHGLSEGQAQRLAIARAILGGAPILLLDEVTSALDAETEKLVLQRIRELPDRTCITVTHRPAALELADWQLKVEESGITCEKISE